MILSFVVAVSSLAASSCNDSVLHSKITYWLITIANYRLFSIPGRFGLITVNTDYGSQIIDFLSCRQDVAGGGAVAAAQHPQHLRPRVPEPAVEQGTVVSLRLMGYGSGEKQELVVVHGNVHCGSSLSSKKLQTV